jgi:lysophospholipase
MGVVIETYGAGNGPDKDVQFLRVCKQANDRGVVICNVTQCGRGEVEAHYATGTALLDCGIVPLYDMTVEAALSKLSVLLGNMSSQEARDVMRTASVGEMTDHQNEVKFSFVNSSFVLSVAQALKTSAVGDHLAIAKSIAPVLLCSAAGAGDLELLRSLISGQGLDPNSSDYDLRTPLHIAASERKPKAVELLLSYGARSNVEDRWHRTPLADAIESVQNSGLSSADYDAAVQVVTLLVKNGAKIGGGSRAEMLCRFVLSCVFLYQSDTQNCRLASEGNLKAISVFVMAGGDVNEADYDGRTALHLATGSRCQFVFSEFYPALLLVHHICESHDVLNLIQVLQTKSSTKSPSSCSKRAPNDFPIVGAIRLSRVVQSMV